jgi:DNA-directed RNA polymerase II subunit RPB1
MGIVQDTLLGSRGFTRRDTFIEKDMMMNLVLHLDTFTGTLPVPAILKPRPLWTGKQCQSLILPDFSMARFSNGHPDDETDELSPGDTRVVIDRGELLAGMLDKKALGTGAGGIIHIIANEFGPQVRRKRGTEILQPARAQVRFSPASSRAFIPFYASPAHARSPPPTLREFAPSSAVISV